MFRRTPGYDRDLLWEEERLLILRGEDGGRDEVDCVNRSYASTPMILLGDKGDAWDDVG